MGEEQYEGAGKEKKRKEKKGEEKKRKEKWNRDRGKYCRHGKALSLSRPEPLDDALKEMKKGL